MADIFVSYAQEDLERVRLLARALEREDFTIWWDRAIAPGRRFSNVIEKEIKSARCILVIWSRHSVSSDWVLMEAAEGQGRKILIPVLLDDVEIPLGFRRIQAANLTNWRGETSHHDFRLLVQAIKLLLGESIAPDTVIPEPDEIPSVTDKPSKPDIKQLSIIDSPAKHDALNRKILAAVIATRFRQLRVSIQGVSFLVHIDGPWGVGKTTLLNLLRQQFTQDDAASEWLIVDFDAWRESQVGPPWWSLIERLRSSIASQLNIFNRIKYWLNERFRLTGIIELFSILIIIGFAVAVFTVFRPDQISWTSIKDVGAAITAIAGALSILLAGGVLIGRYISFGSSSAARIFVKFNRNPMGSVSSHFGWLIKSARKPVLFLIDDLDRCPHEYVVGLLESIQTLVRDAHLKDGDSVESALFVVVAADGQWIRRSYESNYTMFDGIAQQGRTLGYLFLDKLFQLTIPVPALSKELQSVYMKQLLAGDQNDLTEIEGRLDQDIKTEIKELFQKLEKVKSEDDLLHFLSEASLTARLSVTETALDALLAADVRKTTDRALFDYADKLPPNPRSVKRFVLTYNMLRAIRTLEGSIIGSRPLAVWTILQLRWPVLADYLQENPEAAKFFGNSELPDEIPDVIKKLFSEQEVLSVAKLDDANYLSPELVRSCCGTADVGIA